MSDPVPDGRGEGDKEEDEEEEEEIDEGVNSPAHALRV